MLLPAPIVSRYLSKKPEELQQCEQYLEQSNFSELKNVGHKFKGSGSTFGFPEFTVIGAKLEQAAKEEDKAKVKEALAELKAWIHQRTTN